MKNKKTNKSLSWLIAALSLLVIYALIVLFLPQPKINATLAEITLPKNTATAITWPNYGQSAVGVVGQGLIATSNEQKNAPIASIAKTILALCVLKEKPLKTGEQGPLYTITQNDIDLYKSNVAQNGSVMPIRLNDQLSEYQLLQGLLIPSGDNIADTLAIWTFGSIENYLAYANDFVAKLGLKNTHLADAGGLSPQTASSASDLFVIGEKLLQNPVLSEIVAQSQVELPVIGKTNNYNTLLGQNGIIGIKTGNTDEAGGCLLSAAKQNIGGKETTIVLAILGATSRAQVLNDTRNFFLNNANSFQLMTAIKAGQVVGKYQTPWGKSVNILAKNDVNIVITNKEEISIKDSFNQLNKSAAKNSEVGTIKIIAGPTEISTPAVLENKLSAVPFWWKLFHPFAK
jgi:D-alanyl-D-alanine carboxypeptidase (penicillin-binding protein 5/6)